jgi:hypothetical protein
LFRIDSDEYKCWHEVGHATACLHLGGDVDFIEFLEGDARGYARAHSVVTPEMERSVACGGFAAEFYLLKHGYAERGPDDERDVSQIVFHNATGDREEFWGRKLGEGEAFARAEDEAFMNHAIGSVAPSSTSTSLRCSNWCASFARQGESMAGGSRNSCGSAPYFAAKRRSASGERRHSPPESERPQPV